MSFHDPAGEGGNRNQSGSKAGLSLLWVTPNSHFPPATKSSLFRLEAGVAGDTLAVPCRTPHNPLDTGGKAGENAWAKVTPMECTVEAGRGSREGGTLPMI